MDLLDIVRVEVTRRELFKLLDDNDLRSLRNVCTVLRAAAYSELKRRARIFLSSTHSANFCAPLEFHREHPHRTARRSKLNKAGSNKGP